MHRYKEEASSLIKLATPVLIASVAQTGMGFVDTVMAGGVSATDMAAYLWLQVSGFHQFYLVWVY